MYSKIVIFAVVLAAAAAQHGHYHGHGHAVSSQSVVLHQNHAHGPAISHAPLVHHQPLHYSGRYHEEHYAPAHYAFDYSVRDTHTGDIKAQHETREGDAVHGFYTLHEADGTVRRVDYTADAHSGFNAVVHREGHATHAAPVHHQPAHYIAY